jgi:hypothetical protein
MTDRASELYGVFLARRYMNQTASQIQWDAFAKWLETNKIDGVSAWRLEEGDGALIAVFDLTGRCSEFSWAGRSVRVQSQFE